MDLELTRGDDRTWIFEVTRENDQGVAQPLDLTDAIVRFTAKRSAADADADAVITKSTDDDISIYDPATGVAYVTIRHGDTAGLEAPLTLEWDLEIDQAGVVSTAASGLLRLRADVRTGASGATQTPLVSPDTVRAVVKTSLSDSELADVIEREEAILAARSARSPGRVPRRSPSPTGPIATPVRLRRPTSAIIVTEDNVTTTDVRLGADARTVQRLTASGWSAGAWTGAVEATYTPNDAARVTSWVIELVRARLTETGYDSEIRRDVFVHPRPALA
jgi:hypothetical protein